MRVFVTGGSGFIGGHVIERLVADGHEALAMARSERSADAVRALGAIPVSCALGEVDPAHLDGVDAIVHCAAFVESSSVTVRTDKARAELGYAPVVSRADGMRELAGRTSA